MGHWSARLCHNLCRRQQQWPTRLDEPTLYQQQYLFYTTREVEQTVADLRSGDDVFHAEPNFDPTRLADVTKDKNRLPTGELEVESPPFQGSWGIVQGAKEKGGGSAAQLDIRGGDGNDAIFGGYYDDSISGGAGSDYLVGSFGDDTINGDAGIDTIFGDQSNPYESPATQDIYNDTCHGRAVVAPRTSDRTSLTRMTWQDRLPARLCPILPAILQNREASRLLAI